ncbi:uncharacterized protein MYCFIDRAFT_174762 [Pseudocercospora fijiensis CIRAD86]|uniref:Uncharacterized protein n=1 Tax=Pseudocercospora fijiensis (strain CIRAD86) TaxID=383855 RepID=M2ZWD8_PSEFD|nr:uncharacterized protein MYCFIDRAFT_174762 [Pseudocercospora fijiensis CIRAD86]EME83299.1 hypothetical protein MYCFIDRAFT_174762 [Pseudocercospora fijiensis CIRAD86]
MGIDQIIRLKDDQALKVYEGDPSAPWVSRCPCSRNEYIFNGSTARLAYQSYRCADFLFRSSEQLSTSQSAAKSFLQGICRLETVEFAASWLPKALLKSQ